MLGESKPVWIADPRDAQYLNTTEQDLLRMAGHEEGEGLLRWKASLPRPRPRCWRELTITAPSSTRR